MDVGDSHTSSRFSHSPSYPTASELGLTNRTADRRVARDGQQQVARDSWGTNWTEPGSQEDGLPCGHWRGGFTQHWSTG